MNESWITACVPCALFALCLTAFFGLTLRRPERLSNSLLLFLALILAFPAVVSLFGEGGATLTLVFAFSALALTLLSPLLLIWNGIVMMKRESGGLANLLSLLLGLGIGAGEIAFLASVFNGMPRSFWGEAIRFFGLSVLYVSVLLLAFVLYVLILPLFSRKKRFDAVIVHGCALIRGDRVSRILSGRLDLALELYRLSEGKALIVVSGGQGDDETVSEAEAMARYLRERGVPESAVLLEDKSRSTEENLINALALLRARGETGELALVTSGYHLYRCLLTARRLGLRCRGFGSKVAAYYWPSAVIREFAAVFSRRPYLVWTIVGYALFVLLPAAALL